MRDVQRYGVIEFLLRELTELSQEPQLFVGVARNFYSNKHLANLARNMRKINYASFFLCHPIGTLTSLRR